MMPLDAVGISKHSGAIVFLCDRSSVQHICMARRSKIILIIIGWLSNAQILQVIECHMVALVLPIASSSVAGCQAAASVLSGDRSLLSGSTCQSSVQAIGQEEPNVLR